MRPAPPGEPHPRIASSGGTITTTGNPTLADIMNLRGLPLNLPVLNNFSLSDIRALRGLDLAEITWHRGLACLGPGTVGHYCPTGGNLVGQIGHFVWKNRGTIATVIAVGVCLSGFGAFACGGALAGAYAVRAEQRIATYGFSRSLRANAADAVMTTWFAIPMAGAIITFGASLPLRYMIIVNGVSTIPDDVQLVGGFLPGHDPVFLNGNTLSP